MVIQSLAFRASQRGVATVFQSYKLDPPMTVAENMPVGRRLAGTPKEEIREEVGTAAKISQLFELLERCPHQLSDGQRQRVAIGRAIERNPKAEEFAATIIKELHHWSRLLHWGMLDQI